MNILKYIKEISRRLPFYFISPIFRLIYSPTERIIVCNSSNFTSYSCNPKYITEYFLNNFPNRYEIYWVFKKRNIPKNAPKEVHLLILHSFQYFKIIHSAHYIFSNQRVDKFELSLQKHSKQKYINTWHGSLPFKRIEKDVEDVLGEAYVKKAKYDSSICDLMFSGNKFHTDLYRSSFWYNGEILESGTPRCDILFNESIGLKESILAKYKLDKSSKYLLYAPTFRSDYSLDTYKFQWDDVIDVLKRKTGHNYVVLLKLHPNFLKRKDVHLEQYLNNHVIDVSKDSDMQELLVISDILVTDYSSCVFEFSLLRRPGFMFATDLEKYDRGFYFSMDELPYPYASSESELISNIENFEDDSYQSDLDRFFDKIGNLEKGNACEHLLDWMNKH